MSLSQIVQTNPDFTRSINLINDLSNLNASKRYVWGKSNGRTLDAILYALGEKDKQAAFSLIGPFGTGKSSFVLQLLHLLGAGGKEAQKSSFELLKNAKVSSLTLLDKLNLNKGKSFTILITGKQESLHTCLLNGISESLKKHEIKSKKLTALIHNGLKTNTVDFKEVFKALDVELYLNFSRINIVIDEFGKLLEYAALHPSQSDLYHLQEIAELRKNDLQCNLMVLTILHQAFEGYAKYLNKQSQNEWAKIQGRFQSIHISEDPEELVPLISNAFDVKKANSEYKKVASEIKKFVNATLKNSQKQLFVGKSWSTAELEDIFQSSFVINPVALFVLPYLSKTAGQNTRSTFTFLNSHEPLALKSFLEQNDFQDGYCPQVDLAYLYDYFTHNDWQKINLGGKWNEVEVALGRVQDLDEVNKQVLKIIGVLNILQLPKKYPATKELIELSLAGSGLSSKMIQSALDHLIDLKIILYRKFAKEFRIWEGSDFNVEQALSKRDQVFTSGVELIRQLNILCPQPIFLAKRHYEETGTLRHFNVKFIDSVNFQSKPDEEIEKILINDGAEGGIGLVACLNQEEYNLALDVLSKQSLNANLIFILAEPDLMLFDLLKECISLGDILGNEPELLRDNVAQKEVSSRLLEAQDRLNQKIGSIYWSFSKEKKVFQSGKQVELTSRKEFNKLMSDALSKYFNKAPKIYNELMNKPKISPSASSARKALIKIVLNSKNKPDLEVSTVPGTNTLFTLLYKKTGMFEKVKGIYQFKKPKDENWLKIWNDLTDYFDKRFGEDIKLQDLLNHFEAAPYGIRQPVMLMFMMAYLETPNTGVALYDEGTYAPQRDEVLYEILNKRAKHFSLRKFGKAENEKVILSAIYRELSGAELEETEDMLFDTLKVLFKPIRLLPSFVNQTRQIDEKLLKIRNTFLKTNKPEDLIFIALPEILGFDRNQLLAKNNEEIASEFAKSVHRQLNALSKVIETVKSECLTDIQAVFGLNSNRANQLRAELLRRVKGVDAIASDPKVKNLILKVKNTILKDDVWAESLLTAIAVKPLNSWNDFDKQDFPNKCKEMYRTFKNYELLVMGLPSENENGEETGVRYSLTTQNGLDINEVIYENFENKEVVSLTKHIDKLLEEKNIKVRRAVLIKLLQSTHEEKKSK